MNLFYRESGHGFPLVVLHGLYGSSDNWMGLTKQWAENYRVIAVDLRNHGASPKDVSHTYSDMVADLAWLFNDLQIESAHILGHSMGGKVAIAFAADYPELVKSLIVADISPRNYLTDPSSAIQYSFHKQLLTRLNSIDLKTIEKREQVESILKTFIPEAGIRMFILKSLHRNRNHEYDWKFNVPVLYKSLTHILSGVDASDYDDRIPITAYPVLFIKGGLSGYITSEDELLIKQMYPQAKIEQIEGATHWLHAEKPQKFNAIVTNFLNSIH
jgi:esterase